MTTAIINKSRGIALIEVLFSLVLIGAGIVTIVRALDICARLAGHTLSAQKAEEALEEVLLQQMIYTNGQTGFDSGRCTAPYDEFSWEARKQPLEGGRFSRLVVSVDWTDGGKERRVTTARTVLR